MSKSANSSASKQRNVLGSTTGLEVTSLAFCGLKISRKLSQTKKGRQCVITRRCQGISKVMKERALRVTIKITIVVVQGNGVTMRIGQNQRRKILLIDNSKR